jgi:hypothetical protein
MVILAKLIPLLLGLVIVKLPVVVCDPPANVIEPVDVAGLIEIGDGGKVGPGVGVGVGTSV